MNLQAAPISLPLNVVMTNPLCGASRLLTGELLGGRVLRGAGPGAGEGARRLRLKLLSRPEEEPQTLAFKTQVENCAFGCLDSVDISHDLQSIFDSADVICICTNLPNPNRLEIKSTEEIPQEVLEALEQIKLIAKHLEESFEKEKSLKLEKDGTISNKHKPIIITDGLISLHVISAVSGNNFSEIFYCPNALATIGKFVLGEHLKVKCDVINDLLIWAADDETFHIEVENPVILHDDLESSKCDRELIGKGLMESLHLDHTQFNGAWIKNDFVEKTKNTSQKNPYGQISKAYILAETLKTIWSCCREGNKKNNEIYCNMGVISDGSYGTERGCIAFRVDSTTLTGIPSVLPIVFRGGKWSVNMRFETDAHVKNEMKKICATSKKQSAQLTFLRTEGHSESSKHDGE